VLLCFSVERKLREGKYETAAELVSDFEMIVWNWNLFCTLTDSKHIAPKADDVYKKLVSQLNLLSQ
jgi:hypothetical protein